MPDWNISEVYSQRTTCEHRNTRPTKARKRNGVVCVYVQCQDCGDKLREVRKAGHNLEKLPWFNEQLRERMFKRNQAIREQLERQWFQERDAERAEGDTEFWNGYNVYLKSAQWQKVRRAVLIRDNYRCQNCFDQVFDSTAHVHHLSYVGYRRVGHSFAFECVTLCAGCHEEFHGGFEDRRPDNGWEIPF